MKSLFTKYTFYSTLEIVLRLSIVAFIWNYIVTILFNVPILGPLYFLFGLILCTIVTQLTYDPEKAEKNVKEIEAIQAEILDMFDDIKRH